MAVATTGVAGSMQDFQPGEGKWGIRTIVCHLADTETVFAMRIRQMIAEDNPVIPAIDQDLWAQRLDYNKRKLSQALETFRRTRAENYELLKDLPEAAFTRTAQHTKRGVVTLMEMLQIFARHPEKHVGQIQAVRAAYKEFKAAQAQSATPSQ